MKGGAMHAATVGSHAIQTLPLAYFSATVHSGDDGGDTPHTP